MARFVLMSVIPAETKRKENIAEYVIHMYQTEDLILSYDFNLDAIDQYVIRHMSQEDQVRKQLLLWYAGIIDQMQSEGIVDGSKRLNSTQVYVDKLTEIHYSLMELDTDYRRKFTDAVTDINQHIAMSHNTIRNPIQICINGLYGMLILKLSGKKIAESDEVKLKKFGAVLAYLSYVFKKDGQI